MTRTRHMTRRGSKRNVVAPRGDDDEEEEDPEEADKRMLMRRVPRMGSKRSVVASDDDEEESESSVGQEMQTYVREKILMNSASLNLNLSIFQNHSCRLEDGSHRGRGTKQRRIGTGK